MTYVIFYLEDEDSYFQSLRKLIDQLTADNEGSGVKIQLERFTEGQRLIDAIRLRTCDLAFIDLELSTSELQGRDVIKRLHAIDTETQRVPPLVVVTAYPEKYKIEEALRDGVYEYFRKGSLASSDGDFQRLGDDLARRGIKAFIENHFDLPSLYNYRSSDGQRRYGINSGDSKLLDSIIVGESSAVLQLKARLAAAARSDLPVLVFGPSGSGKELAAEMIHRLSDRGRDHYNWVAVNCAAFTRDLMASELFGHVKGAFTGAMVDKKGLLAEANRSTLFLDEVGHASEQFQSLLLRALSTKKARLVGSNEEYDFDVRLVAATDRSLRESRLEKSFLNRLAGICIEVPSLSERLDDISNEGLLGYIVANFLKEINHEGTTIKFTEGAIVALRRYSWPGNIRELTHIVRASCDSVVRRSDMGSGDPIFIDAAYVSGLLKQTFGNLTSHRWTRSLDGHESDRQDTIAATLEQVAIGERHTYKSAIDSFAAHYVHHVHYRVLNGDKTTSSYDHTADYLRCSTSTVKQRLAEWEQLTKGSFSNAVIR